MRTAVNDSRSGHRSALVLATVLGVVMALVGAGPASAAPLAAAHHQLRAGAHPAARSGLTLAQAPAGLRAAVRKTLGGPDAVHDDAFHQAELTAADGAANDLFGGSVAVSGSTAVVGAYNKNSTTGAAYVFTRSGGAWSQQAKLTAADGGIDDQFGWSVAISGSTLVVGAWGKNKGTGAAYVFVRSHGAWSQQAELTAADGAADDEFGWSVAVSGSTAVVGTGFRPTDGAYVFARSHGAWSQQAELTAADATGSDRFGASVAISGGVVVVGAYGKSDGTGAAYVFAQSGVAWSQQAELTAADGSSGDEFGWSVAISGSTAVVGAPSQNMHAGAAYVFTRAGAAWSQRVKLTAADGATDDLFGGSVAISGGTVVVGASSRNSNTGAAYAFVSSGGAWFQQAELTATGGTTNDDFGGSVAISGSAVVAGAAGKNSDTGAAYTFVLPSQQAELTAADGSSGDEFGWSVAISGSTAVVGAYGQNSFTGAAYVFVRSHGAWSRQAKLTAADGIANDLFGYSVAISGSTAVVGAWGHNSFTGAAYVFVRSGTAWSTQAELTAADGTSGDDFGSPVAVSGGTVVVGASSRNSNTGAAYVFARSGAAWHQQAELTAFDGTSGDLFGASVAVSGSTAVVGAYAKNSLTGEAYVFARSGRTWSPTSKLSVSDGVPDDEFGVSVAISGSAVMVGADGRNSSAGAVYAYTCSGAGCLPRGELTAGDGAANSAFGAAVAISGRIAVVGAAGGNSGHGAVYVFTHSGTTWSQRAELGASDSVTGGGFGSSVTISGTAVAVGASAQNSQLGAAYVFANA